MSLTFKQFNEYVEAPLTEDERIDELFGIFKNNEQKAAAERKKLELLAKRGNEVAQMKLNKLERDDEKRGAATKFKRKSDDEKFKDAKTKQDAENQEKANKAELARLRKEDPKAYAAAVFAKRGKEGQYPSATNTSNFYSKMRHSPK